MSTTLAPSRPSHRRSPALLEQAKRTACPDPVSSTVRTDRGLADARLVRSRLTDFGASAPTPVWLAEFAAGREARMAGGWS